jgi:cytochrome c peroxidase
MFEPLRNSRTRSYKDYRQMQLATRAFFLIAICAAISCAWALAQEAAVAPKSTKEIVAPEKSAAEEAKPAAPEKSAAESFADEADEVAPDGPTEGLQPPAPNGVSRNGSVRPSMTAEQRTDWAARLREIYQRPSNKWPPPLVDRTVEWKELAPLPEPKVPPAKPTAAEQAEINRAELGKLLFFDPRLSGSGQIACASCHDPDLSWADGRTVAIGNRRKPLRRNAPSIMNVGLNHAFFWDGRAKTLEEQARAVLFNPDEMDSTEDVIVGRLSGAPDYRKRFAEVYGDDAVTIDRVATAIAAFESAIVGGRSPFDKFLRGRADALTDEAVIGLHLFRTEARCLNCHHGVNFTDNRLHEVGLSYYGRKLEDLGHFKISQRSADVGRFKTPSLRNVANTKPYMHNGLFPLEGVLNMYNAGMPTIRRKPHQKDDPLFPAKSPLLEPLYLNRQDLLALKTFLESLSEPPLRIRPPELPADGEVASKK